MRADKNVTVVEKEKKRAMVRTALRIPQPGNADARTRTERLLQEATAALDCRSALCSNGVGLAMAGQKKRKEPCVQAKMLGSSIHVVTNGQPTDQVFQPLTGEEKLF